MVAPTHTVYSQLSDMVWIWLLEYTEGGGGGGCLVNYEPHSQVHSNRPGNEDGQLSVNKVRVYY